MVGSSELFLYGVDKIITKIDYEQATFTWISKQACMAKLGGISEEMFDDACLLLGSSLLDTFPPYETPIFHNKDNTIRDVIEKMKRSNMNAAAIIASHLDDPSVQSTQYQDKYRRAYMSLKHHVILTMDGKVEPLNAEQAPGDVHMFFAHQLPAELYTYLSRGVLSPQVPNWLTSEKISVSPPLDNAESEAYRTLVRDQLTPLRSQSLLLLAESMHRAYLFRKVTQRFWWDEKEERSITMRDLPSIKDKIASWNVREQAIKEQSSALQAAPFSLKFALASLKDTTFASKTVVPRNPKNPLSTDDEIVSNALWRFLQLREFIDQDHQLTAWGKCLEAALSSLDPSDGLEEPVFLAIELLRLDLLTEKDIFPTLSGGPMRGSETDKRNSLLLSRLACFGKFRHKPIGYSGPLSRQLLAYHSMGAAVRSGLRDLLEITLTSLMMNGDADRERNDFTDLSIELPFVDEKDCALGIAVRTYFDELTAQSDPTSSASRAAVKSKGKNWFQHCMNFAGNIDAAFRLWDAVGLPSCILHTVQS